MLPYEDKLKKFYYELGTYAADYLDSPKYNGGLYKNLGAELYKKVTEYNTAEAERQKLIEDIGYIINKHIVPISASLTEGTVTDGKDIAYHLLQQFNIKAK